MHGLGLVETNLTMSRRILNCSASLVWVDVQDCFVKLALRSKQKKLGLRWRELTYGQMEENDC